MDIGYTCNEQKLSFIMGEHDRIDKELLNKLPEEKFTNMMKNLVIPITITVSP